MAKEKESKTVWLASLYRFGYDLTAIGETKEKAIATVLKEYSRAFKQYNNGASSKEIAYGNVSYYANAKEDINCTEFEYGKCYWE